MEEKQLLTTVNDSAEAKNERNILARVDNVMGILKGNEWNGESQEKEKPSMYTFFQRINLDHRSTGMSDGDDDQMLELWKREWQNAGFNTFVLTIEDAQRHPLFQDFERMLEEVPLNSPTRIYNQMCYYRHLAMSAVGGGYLSDYDVLPVMNDATTTVPFPIKITDDSEVVVYSKTLNTNGGIPCLMSGSASKWERLAFNLLENGLKHPGERIWSDMYAMIDLRYSSFYQIQDAVIKFGNSNEYLNPSDCEQIQEKVAIHFSHHGLKEIKKKASDRPTIAKEWLQEWRSSCLD